MDVKTIFVFFGGIVLGAAAGVLCTKRHFQEKYRKQYEQDHDDLERYFHIKDEYEKKPGEENSSDTDRTETGQDDQNVEIESEKVNYSNYYDGNVKVPDTIEEEEKSEQYKRDEEAFDDHQMNKNRPPKIISAEAYENLPPHIDQDILYYYAVDNVLCTGDDAEEPLDNPLYFVGDCLEKYNFIDSDESIIFVMNYALETCYEIQKFNARWSDTH